MVNPAASRKARRLCQSEMGAKGMSCPWLPDFVMAFDPLSFGFFASGLQFNLSYSVCGRLSLMGAGLLEGRDPTSKSPLRP